MGILLGLSLGVGLSAACGFRVFVPLLGMSIASMSGQLTLADGFEWIGSIAALMAFAAATAGFGNFLVSTGELISSVVVSVLAIFAPFLAIIILAAILYKIYKRFLVGNDVAV